MEAAFGLTEVSGPAITRHVFWVYASKQANIYLAC